MRSYYQGLRKRHRELILNGYRVSILGDEKVLERENDKFYAMLLPHAPPKKKNLPRSWTLEEQHHIIPQAPRPTALLSTVRLDSSGIYVLGGSYAISVFHLS